jgi:NADPH-dependent ferric siderophore reductase
VRRPPITLEVVRRVQLTPHLVRLTLGGAGFAEFEDRPETDKYVKLQMVSAGGHPITRTYTIRAVDSVAQTLDLDFVVHGDEGIAAPWAARAEPGETVSLSGPGGGYSPNPDADAHLFAGDASALPAIAAALETLADTAAGAAFIEVESADDVIDVAAPTRVMVQWVVAPAGGDALVDAVRAWDWPDGDVEVFAHGEREAMKALRRLFLDERGLTRDALSLSGYWARGRTEDRFQAEKREPIGQIFPDA